MNKEKTNDMSYAGKVTTHLGCYCQRKYPNRVNGLYRGIEKLYILQIFQNERKDKIVLDYNVLDGLKDRCIELIKKPHPFAHHLNSSQIMCYNFFRRMIDVDDSCNDELGWYGHPNNELQQFVKDKIGATITENAKCRFEYIDTPKYNFVKAEGVKRGGKETSSFDFYIEEGTVKVFFEIKYTENDFGSKNTNVSEDSLKNHLSYFKSGYREMIETTSVFKRGFEKEQKYLLKNNIDRFDKSYQLLRNVLRIDNNSTYSVFIFPQKNPIHKKFEKFITEFSINTSNVKELHWEELTNYMSEDFIIKYLDFD